MRVVTFAIFAVAAGCNNPVYLSEHRPLETLAAAMGQNGFQPDSDLYVLPVRRPSQSEQQALKAEQMQKMLPMPVPWAGTRDFDVQIEWSAKNLDTQPVTAFLALTGGNEFGDYDPQAFIDPNAPQEDQTPPPPLLGGSPIALAPNEIKSGFFREDQMHEASIDLEAITRYPAANGRATPFEVIEHDSTASTIGLENVPKNDVTPVMVRYRLTLSADGHVALDYTVRVRDHNNKLAAPTDPNLYVSGAANLPPPVSPMANMAGP